MRIQPIDSLSSNVVKSSVLKLRLKRFFDRPFNGVLRISSVEKLVARGDKDGGGAAKFEPSSVCLDKMVQNFMEDNNEKTSLPPLPLGMAIGSDDKLDFFSDSISANSSFDDPFDTLRNLIPCATVSERNLLAHTLKIVEKNNRTYKRKRRLKGNSHRWSNSGA
ncbi:uncharacterized protein LOC131024808 [Salvia miltiorrhiza]|uniref:uncharacterized protein LOC131024808 n=1 Tax=Salvia miltiorrhiza TaxID=226208 RepID=UPI0025AC6D70|nr:uncharacterized protein LOC131024808 [Salvia miltiorrhiza]